MGSQDEMMAALIGRSLGLGPEWTVVRVEIEEPVGKPAELHVYVERTPGHALPCPRCGCDHGVYDTRERTWRHLDIWQYKTFIHCRLPRLDCPGGPVTAEVPWASPQSKHFTALFEAQVLLMAMSSMPVRGIARLVRENDTRVWAMLNRIVGEAHSRADFSGVTQVGVDETARRRGHSYISTFVDLDGGRAVFCELGRDASTVASFAAELEAHGGDPAAVEVVTCDLSPAFAKGVAVHLPNAKRVADRFHVVQIASRQVDKVRVAESRESKEKRALLAKSKHIGLKNEGNLTERQAARKRELSRERLKTARACQMREALQAVYECETRGEAEAELDALCSWIMHSNVPQMKEVAKTLRRNRDEVLNYFDHRLTNAVLEGMNSVIQSAKRLARGFRNPEYFKTVIYLKLGKLTFPQLEVCATH